MCWHISITILPFFASLFFRESQEPFPQARQGTLPLPAYIRVLLFRTKSGTLGFFHMLPVVASLVVVDIHLLICAVFDKYFQCDIIFYRGYNGIWYQ